MNPVALTRGVPDFCEDAVSFDGDGHLERRASPDTRPCVERGTCTVVADTDWNHPDGGTGVECRQG